MASRVKASRAKSKQGDRKLQSSTDPVSGVFQAKHLPPELTKDIDIKSDIIAEAHVEPEEVFKSWLKHRYPTLTTHQDCKDVISDRSDEHDDEARSEIMFGARLALFAYCMPYTMARLVTQMHLKNNQLNRYVESFVAESTFLAYSHMDEIVEGTVKEVVLPETAEMAGYYIRTPVRLWAQGPRGKMAQGAKPVYTIPSFEQQDLLLPLLVIGDCNCYVMRRAIGAQGHEIYLLFRGTSNAFNGLHQYGRDMTNTQLYRMPDYDILQSKFVTLTSEQQCSKVQKQPLFYFYYANIIEDLYPHIMLCLEKLHASSAHRIVVAGHSMGAALVQYCCYLMRHRHPELWAKMYFRAYACPMACNDAAVFEMEQWIIDSMQPNKYIEVVNNDDYINIQYLFGGEESLKVAISKGKNQVGNWLLNYYFKTNPTADADHVPRMMRIFQLYPDIAASAFLNGAIRSQVRNVSREKAAAHRIGQRRKEVKVQGSDELSSTYNGTLKVFFCERRVQWEFEYVGKSHANYMDLNFNMLWAPLRLYEDNLYKFYHQHGLKHNNALRIVPMFPADDLPKAAIKSKDAKPPILASLDFSRLYRPKTFP